jgi:hypothetical protein
MKRTAIGIALMIIGILDMLGIIITSAISLASISDWSYDYPSRLWYLIFAGKPQMQNGFASGSGGLALGFLFVVGVMLLITGLIILAIEYFNIDKGRRSDDQPR